jgi:chaperone modulatory protein CbpM
MIKQDIVTGLLLDDETCLTLGELCRVCTVHAEWIIELVDEGILDPSGPDAAHWRFSGPSLLRALRVRRLQQDLGINLAGAALVLDLLDEVESLRARLRVLEGIDRF